MTSISPFATFAPRLREQGLAVMPCGPGTKFPGIYSGKDGWRTAWDWQKYCDRLPTERFEMSIWERWPDAGICLALGKSSAPAGFILVAVDIDTEEPDEVAAIRSVLPGSPVRKRGAKGETEFYLGPETVPNRPYNNTLVPGAKRRMLDLLGHGRQTVMPGSIHPDTGAPYYWTTIDTLEDFDVAELPVLPADIADRLSVALAPFGHVDAPTVGAAGNATLDGEATIHRQLNDAALANLAAWVPALSLYKCRQVGGRYKAVSAWRPSSSGRPLSQRATNLAIGPDGIKDCGEGKGYTPIDLVMAACGADLDSAFRWLQERVAPAKPVILSARVVDDEPEDRPFVRTSAPGNLLGLRLAAVDGVAVEAPAPTCKEILQVAPPSIISPEDCTPPGLLGDIVAWMNAASPVPSPQLNLSMALAFLGTLYGRYYESASEVRTNVYCMGIAKSGFGKSFPLKCVNAIEQAAGLERFFGPAGLKSDSALRLLLSEKNPVFVPVDEVGVLLSKILHRRAGSHEAGLAELLLTLFSVADDVYRGSDGVASRAVAIYTPHLCLAGMSTPSAFWSAFTTANSEHGLLPRMLIFDAGEREPDKVVPTASRRDVPQAIIKAIHGVLDASRKGNLSGMSGRVVAQKVPMADDAAVALLQAIEDEARTKRRASTGLEELAYTRFAEHVQKLALIYSVGCDPIAPKMTTEALRWANSIVKCTTKTLLDGTIDRVADNEYQADYKRILRMVKDAGTWGVPTRVFYKQVAGSIKKRELGDILDQLKSAGDVEIYIGSGPKGGKPCERIRNPIETLEAV